MYYARKRDVIELEQPAKIGPTIPLVEVQIGWYPGTADFRLYSTILATPIIS